MANFVDRLLLIIDAQTKQANAQLKRTEKQIQAISKGMQMLKRNMLGFGLSALFTGMAIKRLGDNIMKSLVKTYLTATDEQSKFNQQLLGVQGSFEFLKFSIMDALSQSDLVIGFIENLIELTNRVSGFISKHPDVAKFIGLFTATAIVGGGIAMVIGQTTLALVGVIAGFALWKDAIIAIKATKFVKWMVGLKTATWAAFLPYVAIGLALLFLVDQFLKLKEFTGSWGTAFKAMGLVVLRVLAFIGDAFLNNIIISFNLTAEGINKLIGLWNKLARTKFGRKFGLGTIDFKLPEISTNLLGTKVDSMLDKLAMEVAVERALAKEREDDAAKAGVNITVEGDITDEGIIGRIEAAIEEKSEGIKTRIGVPVEE